MPEDLYDLSDLPGPVAGEAAAADPYNLDDVPAAPLERRGMNLGARMWEGVQDIGRAGMALPALGEQLVSMALDVPDDSTPFSSTLADMALGEAADREGDKDTDVGIGCGEDGC